MKADEGLLASSESTAQAEQTRVVLQQLDHKFANSGIKFPGGAKFICPPPLLAASLSGNALPKESKLEKLTGLAGKAGWESFSRRGLNAPTAIQIEALTAGDGVRVGYSVHNAYILYAALEKLRDRDLMETTFGRPGSRRDDSTLMRELTMREKVELGLSEDGDADGYMWLELPLLRKVLICGVVHLQKRDLQDGFQLFWELDPRFASQHSTSQASSVRAPRETNIGAQVPFANTWSSLSKNDLGGLEIGEPQPYVGLGGYMAIHSTGQAEDQWLVESRMLIHEPTDWFGGSKYLRTKLPLSLRESAKTFRRKLR